MRKTFYLLLLMILVLPSLGLTSAMSLIMWLYTKDKGSYEFRWKYVSPLVSGIGHCISLKSVYSP